MLGIMIWWFAGARKWFKGPKVNIEHQMLGRDEDVNVINGQQVGEESGGDSSTNSITKETADNHAAALA